MEFQCFSLMLELKFEILRGIISGSKTTECLRRLIIDLSEQRPRFDYKPVHAMYVQEKEALRQTFYRVLWLSPVSITAPT